jgi:allantoinase
VDDLTLYEAMRRCAELGCLVAVHAENEAITAGLTRRALVEGRTGPRDFITSRPVIAETEAIARAIFLAEETGCALHVVHVTTGRGIALVAAAQARGVNVSCETCTHYLVFTDDDIEALGVLGKCAPPLRSAAEQEQLWAYLWDGTLGMVTSDHSASPPGAMAGSNFFVLFGGVCGCQVTRQALFEHGYDRRGLSLPAIATATGTSAARRFQIPRKGDIAIGCDADLALVDLDAQYTLEAADLFSRHKRSAYVGTTMRGRIARTYVRGRLVYSDGAIVSAPTGKLVRPG